MVGKIEIIIMCLCYLFPCFYIYVKEVSNRLIFISSVIGISSLVTILLFVFLLPIHLLLIFIFPQSEVYDGLISVLYSLLGGVYLIGSLLVFPITIGLYKNYNFFKYEA